MKNNFNRRILLKKSTTFFASAYIAPNTVTLLCASRAAAQSCRNTICDTIVMDSRAIVQGIYDYYSYPPHTDNPPPNTLSHDSTGTVLIIGNLNDPDRVEVPLSNHITNVSIENYVSYFIDITVTEGAGKCQFENQACVSVPVDGTWSRDSNGVHYFVRL